MSQVPSERSSLTALAVPIVAIVAAIGIGAYAKKKAPAPSEKTEAPNGMNFVPPPPPKLELMTSAKGMGMPKNSDGTPIFSEAEAGHPVVWSKIDINDRGSHVTGWGMGLPLSLELKDDKGRTWPHTDLWRGGSLYQLVPGGYSEAPKSLTLRVRQFGMVDREIGRITMPKVPAATPVPAPAGLGKPWPGLTAEFGHRKDQGGDNREIRLYYALPEGNLLRARVVGTSYSQTSHDILQLVGGPDKTSLPGEIACYFPYVMMAKTIYIEVVEMSPVHGQKHLTFKDLPGKVLFGQPWFQGITESAPFANGVGFYVEGHDSFPFRPSKHDRSSIPLYVVQQGFEPVFHVKVSGVQPASMMGASIRLETASPGGGRATFPGVAPKEGTTKKPSSTGMGIEFDIEADTYRQVRRAMFAVNATTLKEFTGPAFSPYAPDPAGRQNGVNRLVLRPITVPQTK